MPNNIDYTSFNYAANSAAYNIPNAVYSFPITINKNYVFENNTNFCYPIVIDTTRIAAGNTTFWGNLTFSGGYANFGVVDKDNVTQIQQFVKTFDVANKRILIWLSIPVNTATDKTFYFQWGTNVAVLQAPQVFLTDGIANKFALEDINDDSTWSSSTYRNLTNNGSVAFSTGKIDKGAVFDGTTKSLSNQYTAYYSSLYPYSFCFWFKVNSTAGTYGVCGKLASTYPGWRVLYSAGAIYIHVAKSASLYTQKSIPCNNTNWHFLSVTNSNASEAEALSIQLDGAGTETIISNTLGANEANNSLYFTIGGLQPGNTTYRMNGMVDEMSLFTPQLYKTQNYFKTLYNAYITSAAYSFGNIIKLGSVITTIQTIIAKG